MNLHPKAHDRVQKLCIVICMGMVALFIEPWWLTIVFLVPFGLLVFEAGWWMDVALAYKRVFEGLQQDHEALYDLFKVKGDDAHEADGGQ